MRSGGGIASPAQLKGCVVRKIAKFVAAMGGMLALSVGPASAQVCTSNIDCPGVPEINASAGFETIALLAVIVLIVRELMVRRRQA